MLLIRRKESQIQDLWNHEKSLIDKSIFYRATFNFKMFIFNIYKNLFDNCYSFAMLQKMLEFFIVLWW